MDSRFHYFENALFSYGTRENNREVREWRYALANGGFVGFDVRVSLALNQIPFVDAYHETFFVLLDKRVDVQILCLDAAGGVNHQNTYIAVLDGANGADNRVILLVFRHFRFLADTGCIDEVKILAELVVPRVNRVARRTRNIRHNRSLLADKRI